MKIWFKPFLVIIYILLSLVIVDAKATPGSGNCGNQTNFELYECRIQNICEEYKPDKMIYASEDYKRASEYDNMSISEIVFISNHGQNKPIELARQNYKESMSNIYKCAIIESQINSLEMVKEKLIVEDKTSELSQRLDKNIKEQIEKLNIKQKDLCTGSEKKELFNKLNVLKQTTYETCRYIYYLDYLKYYYSDLSNVLGMNIPEDAQWNGDIGYTELAPTKEEEKAWQKSFTVVGTANMQSNIMSQINEEIDHTKRVFPVVFYAYGEYESNYPLHVILEVIKEDFMVFREKLYKAIWPINQLWYKVMNAMSY